MQNYVAFFLKQIGREDWIQLVIRTFDKMEKEQVKVAHDTANIAINRIKDRLPDIKSARNPVRQTLLTEEIEDLVEDRDDNFFFLKNCVKLYQGSWEEDMQEAYYNLLFLLKRFKTIPTAPIEESFALTTALLDHLDDERHQKAAEKLSVVGCVAALRHSHEMLYHSYVEEADEKSLKLVMNYSEIRDKAIEDYQNLYELLRIITQVMDWEDCHAMFKLLNEEQEAFVYDWRKAGGRRSK